jgi:hypothetical protein
MARNGAALYEIGHDMVAGALLRVGNPDAIKLSLPRTN